MPIRPARFGTIATIRPAIIRRSRIARRRGARSSPAPTASRPLATSLPRRVLIPAQVRVPSQRRTSASADSALVSGGATPTTDRATAATATSSTGLNPPLDRPAPTKVVLSHRTSPNSSSVRKHGSRPEIAFGLDQSAPIIPAFAETRRRGVDEHLDDHGPHAAPFPHGAGGGGVGAAQGNHRGGARMALAGRPGRHAAAHAGALRATLPGARRGGGALVRQRDRREPR